MARDKDKARIVAAATAWCCPEGCAYIEAGRAPECDAVTGRDNWLHPRVASMLKAADAVGGRRK